MTHLPIIKPKIYRAAPGKTVCMKPQCSSNWLAMQALQTQLLGQTVASPTSTLASQQYWVELMHPQQSHVKTSGLSTWPFEISTDPKKATKKDSKEVTNWKSRKTWFTLLHLRTGLRTKAKRTHRISPLLLARDRSGGQPQGIPLAGIWAPGSASFRWNRVVENTTACSSGFGGKKLNWAHLACYQRKEKNHEPIYDYFDYRCMF